MDKVPYSAPYLSVIGYLFRSTTAAIGEFVSAAIEGRELSSVPDANINCHYMWLTQEYSEGTNRHLFDALDGAEQYPLRTQGIRSRKKIPVGVKRILSRRESLDVRKSGHRPYIRCEATRISLLVRNACEEYLEVSKNGFVIPSPLSVVMDYLTIPSCLASKGYALLAIRNYLFESLRVASSSSLPPGYEKISSRDIDDDLSKIWTSLRPRHLSRGDDKLPAPKDNKSRLVREYLSVRSVFCIRFTSYDDFHDYLNHGELRNNPAEYEFSKSDQLDKLPESSEITNELIGTPIPIRGADTLFRGGLVSSASGGLLVAVHGGPGSGKTSFSLAVGAVLAPLGVRTLFLTAEESKEDLINRARGLVPDEIQRMDRYPSEVESWLEINWFKIGPNEGDSILDELEDNLKRLADAISRQEEEVSSESTPPVTCRAVIVLDGLHDIFMHRNKEKDKEGHVARLYHLLEVCREIKAIVILNTGLEWEGDSSLDYLVDVAIRLSQESVDQYGTKPDRRITISKTRHQLCASGTHGLQIAGAKGVRISPQINYQLDKKSIWKTKLPDKERVKLTFKKVLPLGRLKSSTMIKAAGIPSGYEFQEHERSVEVFEGSHVFINGVGSGGKAGLALKLAISPTFDKVSDGMVVSPRREKILVISFLYPEEYYTELLAKLLRVQGREFEESESFPKPALEVIHLYPGYLKPNDLFNRIDWVLEAAALSGKPFTHVVVDGIHNIFLQFPEIEKYGLFWPQLYSSLRSRNLTIITTHTTLAVPNSRNYEPYRLIDDQRSEPLRHTLIQKTDFQFEVEPATDDIATSLTAGETSIFSVVTRSAIGQVVPNRVLYWNRERLVLFASSPPTQIPEGDAQVTDDMFTYDD